MERAPRLAVLALLALLALCLSALAAPSMAEATELPGQDEPAQEPHLFVPLIDASLLSSSSESHSNTESELGADAYVDSAADVTPVKAVKAAAPEPAGPGGCPAEALRRVSLCMKVVREFVAPPPDPYRSDIDADAVPLKSTFSASAVCKLVVAGKNEATSFDDCQRVAGHVFGAAGKDVHALVKMTRQADIHDVCVNLLSTAFPAASNQRFIAATDAPKCGLKVTGGITGFRCLFFHGMGVKRIKYHGIPSKYTEAYDGFLGSMHRYWTHEQLLDGICDTRYYMTDTYERGWNSADLQKEYCDAIAKFNPHVIFTHSMGNMIMAAAIHDRVGACTRVSKSAGLDRVLWYSSQAPWTGSPVAASVASACMRKSGGIMDRIRKAVVRKTHPCGSEPAADTLNPAFSNPRSSMQLSAMKETARNFLSGALCGLDAPVSDMDRWFKQNGAGLAFLSRYGDDIGIVDWARDGKVSLNAPYTGNDGLVAFNDCNTGASYRMDPSSPFYVGSISHQEGTCISNDKPNLGAGRQPCTWYFNRVLDAKKANGLPASRSLYSMPPSKNAYIPYASFNYPRSFLELEDWVPTLQDRLDMDEEIQAAQLAEMRAKVARMRNSAQMQSAAANEAQEQELDQSHLEADAAASHSADAEAEVDVASAAEQEMHAEVEAEAEAQADAAVAVAVHSSIDSSAEVDADAELEGQVQMDLNHESDLDAKAELEHDVLQAQIEHMDE